MSRGFSPTSWHWHTREGRQGNEDQLVAICRNPDGRAVTPILPQSHLSIGIHEISNAWRGRRGNRGDRGPLMLEHAGPSSRLFAWKTGTLRCTDRADGPNRLPGWCLQALTQRRDSLEGQWRAASLDQGKRPTTRQPGRITCGGRDRVPSSQRKDSQVVTSDGGIPAAGGNSLHVTGQNLRDPSVTSCRGMAAFAH